MGRAECLKRSLKRFLNRFLKRFCIGCHVNCACRYAGDVDGKGGIYNFVTKRGLCAGPHSKISWTQVCECATWCDFV